MLRETLFVFAALVGLLVSATHVSHCGDGEPYEGNEVQITDCGDPPCKLRRKNRYAVVQKFVPDRDIDTIVTEVNAILFNVPLPFIGVDGMNACKDIYNPDGSPAGCPLKKGTEYVYRNEFPILEIYPKVSMTIHYSLKSGSDIVTCFEVPAKITS